MSSWMGINETYTYYRIRFCGGEERVLVAGERGIRQSCRRHLRDGKDCEVLSDDGQFLFSVKKDSFAPCKPAHAN